MSFKQLTDKQLRQAWSHMTTARIKRLYTENKHRESDRVNSARLRIIALREQDEAEAFRD